MKKRIKAIICSAISLIFGGIGIQKFYLGQTKRGILYVLFCWTGIPYLLCIVDLIRFIFMSENDFNLKYNSKYLENINYNNTNHYYEEIKNKFDDAIDAEYSYVNDNNKEEGENYNNQDNTEENITIDKALEYYKLIDETLISIKDYNFSAKVKQLNQLFKSIIDKSSSYKRNEIAIKNLDKMLQYNIPTTLKLINSYIDLSSSNLNNVKADIIESIESVIIYLNKVLENIQRDDIIDITSDIDVLKAGLKKDGYV
ncbi:TM2 domain-containing protein [Brachyspira intermedia]|uniref:TM2 domain-containing protein n=1 Tax=Brachyspira intermedia TaxID=84377 RepID=UPI0030049F20